MAVAAPRSSGSLPRPFSRPLELAWAIPGGMTGPRLSVPTVVRSQGVSPSSYPPPAMEPVRGPASPRRTSSGVQIRGNGDGFEPIVDSLSRLEMELHRVLEAGNLRQRDWKTPSLSALGRTRETLIWLDQVSREARRTEDS